MECTRTPDCVLHSHGHVWRRRSHRLSLLQAGLYLDEHVKGRYCFVCPGRGGPDRARVGRIETQGGAAAAVRGPESRAVKIFLIESGKHVPVGVQEPAYQRAAESLAGTRDQDSAGPVHMVAPWGSVSNWKA